MASYIIDPLYAVVQSAYTMLRAVGAEVLNILQKLTMSSPYRPIVMSGPSGSGKSTLLHRLMDKHKDCFAFSVSHTTRKPRPGEVHGTDYCFSTREEMQQAIDNDEFIESAEFSGNLYGTSKKAVEEVAKTGRICILDIDMQGVKNIKATNLNPRYIFIRAPSMDILEKRLRGRDTDTEDAVQRRLASAKAELEYSHEKGSYDMVIVNHDVDIAYEQLEGFLKDDIETIRKAKFKSR
ncbi:guanylate kinase-like isoform X2 [Lineus longissimus]|uniref:guanylate kinase-like isoform X2 n=1 Tax=Lineus longissimus TaxID=88925 RepID=UPI00315D65B3